MLVKVTKDTVKIVEEDYILNKGEYKVNRCYFEFSEEYTDNLVKKAIFEHGDVKIEVVIANNECDIPYEVLNFNTFEVRVYAYEVSGDDLVLRYSPTYTNAYLREGSYDADATQGEEITPSQYQQYEQALNDGLVEVNSKLDDVDTAITETNNLDIAVSKLNKITTVALTKKDSTVETVQILDGEKGETGETGADGKDAKINGVNTLSIEAGSNIKLKQEDSTLTISATGGGGGDSTDYEDLDNLPKINNVELIGNKTTSDLGIVIPTVPTNVSAFTNDAGYLTQHQDLTGYVKNTDYADGNTGGVVKTGFDLFLANGKTACNTMTYTRYNQLLGVDENHFISNGTLENVFTGKGFLTQHQDISGKLDTSKVKSSYSTTSGDVYDVSYINGRFSHETWTFTLEDDTTVDKEVVLW